MSRSAILTSSIAKDAPKQRAQRGTMSLRWAGCFLLLVFSLSPSSSSVGGVGVAEAFAYPMRHYRRPQIQISRSGTDRRKGSRLGMKGGRDDGNNSEDPNPGGMTSWDDDDDSKKKFSELSFFEQVQEWFASEEGKEDVRTYTTSLGIALLLRLLIIEPRYIPSLSMYPTFEVGDQLAVEKVTKRIRPLNRNEVVVFNPPTSFKEIVGDTSRKAKEALIKRIVATEVSFTKFQIFSFPFAVTMMCCVKPRVIRLKLWEGSYSSMERSKMSRSPQRMPSTSSAQC